jgi:osmotically-inducible protein OsmY
METDAMRSTTIFSMLGTCALLSATACGAVQKVEAEVKSNPSVMKGAEDDSLTAAAKVELGKNPKTKGFSVSVKGGVATVSGTGPADAKAEAEKTAKVPGVTSVKNEIVVK